MMQESVCPVIELVGSSPTSWEDAAKNAIETAHKSLWNLSVAEVVELDVRLDDKSKVIAYRAKLRISFKYDNWKAEVGWKVPRCMSNQSL